MREDEESNKDCVGGKEEEPRQLQQNFPLEMQKSMMSCGMVSDTMRAVDCHCHGAVDFCPQGFNSVLYLVVEALRIIYKDINYYKHLVALN